MRARTVALVAFPSLVLGAVTGGLVGRSTLERQWTTGERSYTAEERLPIAETSDLEPQAGTRIFPEMPIGRLRAALQPNE